MRLPTIHGLIRRRVLLNYRVEPDVVSWLLPDPLRPKLHAGFAIAGVCLIRLERVRPWWLPSIVGLNSENAAHRIAVEWTDDAGTPREGVYIPRRDTGSWLNHWAGGRLFPGEHELANFRVTDAVGRLAISVRSCDRQMSIELAGRETDELPASSCFATLDDVTQFFAAGQVGYSVTSDCCRLDGVRSAIDRWQARPLAIEHAWSSFFADRERFPAGSTVLDHALVMRNVPHQWHAAEDLRIDSRLSLRESSAAAR